MIHVITSHIRRLLKGNVFTGVCLLTGESVPPVQVLSGWVVQVLSGGAGAEEGRDTSCPGPIWAGPVWE